jgi:integral membrane protein (TIGR01906 family)
MKPLFILARWLFILCLPLLFIAGSIGLAFNSQWFYEYGFKKYDVDQTTGLAQSELSKVAAGLIAYFNSGDELIDLTVTKDGKPFPLFNQKEITHLKDVKDLFRFDYTVLLGTFLYALLYSAAMFFWRKERQQLAKEVLYGAGLTLLLMVLLGIGVLLDFDRLFLQFHLLSFANEFWMLDPTKDYLIMLVPRGFWFDAVLFVVLMVLAGALILGGAAWGHLKYSRQP